MSTTPSLKDLLAAGAHFGHKKERSHPKAKEYIYVLREGIYIIDLEKTQAGLEKAVAVAKDMAQRGQNILFVGTKPQAADLVKTAAEQAGMPYIVHRWPGGLLTNFETVRHSLKQLEQNEAKIADAEQSHLTKKERLVITDKIEKTINTLGGIRHLKDVPDAMFVVDVVAEATAVAEAHRLGIPVIGICDTNANPETIEYPIPANDDARKTIELIITTIAEAIASVKGKTPAEKPVVATEKSEADVTPEVETPKPARKAKAEKAETEAAE